MNILISSAGQRVSLVRSFQKELLLAGGGKVYAVDNNPILAPACHVASDFKKISAVDNSSFIPELLKVCKDWEIKILIPTIDTELEVLAANREKFLTEGVELVISSLDFVKTCRDKRILNKFFKERNIEIPAPINKNNPTYPIFIKPYDGSLSKDIFLINRPDELKDFHLENEKYMFMEYINPDVFSEYTVDTYYDKSGKLKCVVPRKRLVVRSGEVNKGLTVRNKLIDYIIENLNHIEGARGCLTMQFFYNEVDHRIVGIEINPRFGGGFPLTYLAGANFPSWLIKEYLKDEKIAYFDKWEEKLLMLRYDDEILVKNYEE